MRDRNMLLVAAVVASAIVWPNQVVQAADKIAKKVNELFLDAKLQEISKRQAMKVLLNDGNSVVLRCSEVELSDKMTIRKKK